MKSFKDLIVWQKAHAFCLFVYDITSSFPVEERYGLTSQLRRAVVSIPTNIVEGFKRRSRKDNAHFINISDGSLEEVKYLLLLSRDLKYIDNTKYEELCLSSDEVGRLLNGYYHKMRE